MTCSPFTDTRTDRHTEWLLWAPFQGFKMFSFNLSSRIGPIPSLLCFIFTLTASKRSCNAWHYNLPHCHIVCFFLNLWLQSLVLLNMTNMISTEIRHWRCYANIGRNWSKAHSCICYQIIHLYLDQPCFTTFSLIYWVHCFLLLNYYRLKEKKQGQKHFIYDLIIHTTL